jgi:hypothetical protein
MARSIAEIQAAIIANVQADPNLVQAASTSQTAIWRLWTFIVATAIAILEQLQDVFQSNNEAIINLAAPQTAQWVQDKVFKFQYDATTPQVLQLIDLVPQYSVTDETKRIVTRCSVTSNLTNKVLVKVAKGATPQALTSPEVTALQTYVNTLGVAGIKYVVSSTNSDKIYIQAQIFFAGDYSAIIQANVIAAIEIYLGSLPFNGTLKISDLEIAIRNTEGVNDVIFNNIKARRDADALSAATSLVLSNTIISKQWATVAGYIVGETTTSNTLADTLIFIPE